MTRDPIVEEVRAVRDAIAKEHDYDVTAIFEMLRELERQSGEKRIVLPPRRTKRATSVAAAQQDVAADDATRRR
jgi:hypothetical protein